MQSSIEYIVHQIDAVGIHTTLSKLEAIVKAPESKNVQSAVLSILNLSTIVHPLNCLLQQEQACARQFQESRQSLTSSKLLVHYDLSLPLRLAADVFAYGLRAIISHVMPTRLITQSHTYLELC
jgi:hypothetical protein